MLRRVVRVELKVFVSVCGFKDFGVTLSRSRNLRSQTSNSLTSKFLGASKGPLSTMKPISWLQNWLRLRMHRKETAH